MDRTVRSTKTKIIGVITFVLLAIPGGIWLFNQSNDQPQAEKRATQKVASVTTEKKTDYIKYQGEQGRSALDLLKAHANVKTDSSDFGEFVTTINGEDGGGKKYWLFYVNGKEASVGAGKYATKNGEIIEWKLQ